MGTLLTTLSVVLLLSLFGLETSSAQTNPHLNPGDRIRLTSEVCFKEEGNLRFSSISGDTLWASSKGQLLGCSVSNIGGMEVFQPRSVVATTGMGFLIGAGAGVLFGVVTYSCDESKYDCDLKGLAPIVGGVMGGLAGVVGGIGVGLTKSLGSWKTVPLPPGHPVIRGTPDGRLGIQYSIPIRR